MTSIKDRKIYLSVGVVFLLLIALHYIGLLKPLEGFAENLTLPVLGQMHGISIKIGNNYQFFKNRSDFIQAYEECNANSEKNSVLTGQVKLLTEENAELRNQLHYQQKNPTAQILANVVGRELVSTDQTIIADRGTKDGVKLNDPVIVGQGILIGKVAKVDDTISVIRLLNDNVSRTGATIINQDKSLGVVEGGFGISLKMNLIPRDEIVLVGDQVISSGLETSTPRGLLIGTIAEVENEAYKPFQQAIVTPATDLGKLTVVSIILSN